VRREQIMKDPLMAGMVERYHTWPTLRRESVGEHSHAMIIIYVHLFGIPRPQVMWYITTHDLPELHTGDLPFPVKAKYPELGAAMKLPEYDASQAMRLLPAVDISQHEMDRVKICDLLQMHRFGMREMHMGNQYAEPIVRDTAIEAVRRAGAMCDGSGLVQDLVINFISEGGYECRTS
jgi:5'-deoxynucleotidase YfbR-like HD superfamily hydrolase